MISCSPYIIAREKVALLIGNQRYECSDLNRLKHTEEEVRKVAEKLSELNFKVYTHVHNMHLIICCMYTHSKCYDLLCLLFHCIYMFYIYTVCSVMSSVLSFCMPSKNDNSSSATTMMFKCVICVSRCSRLSIFV